MKVRTAKKEDNEAIRNVLDSYIQTLKAKPEDPLLTDVVDNLQSQSKTVIIAELENKIIGIMSICTDPDYKLLNEVFDLKEYHRLLKPDFLQTIKDSEDLQGIPDDANNAIAVDLYFSDGNSKQVLIELIVHAFALYPGRDYIIITKPHIIKENSLSQFFAQAHKRQEALYDDVLYILHKNKISEIAGEESKTEYSYRPITEEHKKLPNVVGGLKMSKTLKEKLKDFLSAHSNNLTGKPGIAFIVVGDREDSSSYIKRKTDACAEVGVNHFTFQFPSDTSEHTILKTIEEINVRDDIHGLIVQLPLPDSLDSATNRILNHVSPAKDVDGLSDRSLLDVFNNSHEAMNIPCAPAACLHILKKYNIDLNEKHCVVISRSRLVGLPLSEILLQRNATVTVCQPSSTKMRETLKQGDIIFSDIGIPYSIKGEWIKPGAVVLDISTNFLKYQGEDKIVGDVRFHEVVHKAELISPVPGGVGPLIVCMLLKNVIKSWARQKQIKLNEDLSN